MQARYAITAPMPAATYSPCTISSSGTPWRYRGIRKMCIRDRTTPYSPTTLVRFPVISHRKRSVWCFLFVTLFNLQGTRRFRRNIVIIHDFIPFVKNFFRKFLTFLPVRRCTHQFFIVSHSRAFVKKFFNFFRSLGCRLSAKTFVL